MECSQVQKDILREARALLNDFANESKNLVHVKQSTFIDETTTSIPEKKSTAKRQVYCGSVSSGRKELVNSSGRSTLDRIMMHQEVARARRVLRAKNNRLANQTDTNKRTQSNSGKQHLRSNAQNRNLEEKLIQAEMARIREEMKQNDYNLVQSNEIGDIREVSQINSRQDEEGTAEIEHSKDVEDFPDNQDSTVDILGKLSPDHLELARDYFNTWKYELYRTRWLLDSCRIHYNTQLLKTILNQWQVTVFQQKVKRELENTRKYVEMYREKEEKACFFRCYTLKLRYIQIWRANARWCRTSRTVKEQQKLRQEKERDFLSKLNRLVAEKQTQQKEKVSSRSVTRQTSARRHLKSKSANQAERMTGREKSTADESSSSQCCEPDTSNPVLIHPSSLKRTLMEQRQRIAAQNREIASLKSLQRQMELELRAKNSTKVKNVTRVNSGRLSRTGDMAINDTAEAYHDTDLGENNDGQKDSTPSKVRLKSKFILKMEERAAKTAKLRAEREERKKLFEEKKKMEKAKELEEEAKRIRAEKQARLEAERAKKLEEEERKKKREEWLLEQREKLKLARRVRELILVRHYGWNPWRRFLERRHHAEVTAASHYTSNLIRCVFTTWFEKYADRKVQLIEMAEKLHRRQLLKSCMVQFCQRALLSYMQANAWYEHNLLRKLFTTWSIYVTEMRIWKWQLDDMAAAHYCKSLKCKCMQAWLEYLVISKAESARERRREQLRWKLRDLIPDFSPPNSMTQEVL